jgi:hypothetical protein
MARTAVVAGTATAVAGGVHSHQSKKQQAAYDDQAAQQAAFESQAQLAEMQAQMDAMKAQQAVPAAAPAAAAPTAPGVIDDTVMAELQKLADLKNAGVLDDAEFAAAKAKILGI